MAKLLLIEQGKVRKEVPIVAETTRIGREQLNHVRIGDPTVSRFHAEIVRRGYCYSIEDRQSTNGTLLNGNAIRASELLGDRDVIAIGSQTLVFVLEAHDRPEPLTAHSFDSGATVRLGAD